MDNNVENFISNQAYKVLEEINKELKDNNIININYLLLQMSNLLRKDLSIDKNELTQTILVEVNKLLIKYSNTYREIVDNKEYSSVYLFIYNYMEKILGYYDSLMMFNQDKFDRYVGIASGNEPKLKIIKQENLFMSIDDIQNTMHLLNEAVRNYYELYNNKTLFATFTDEQVIGFKIKEAQLAHLLGVNLREIVNNQVYVDIFKITPKEIEYINDTTYLLDPNGSATIDVLHKIVDICDGNLLQFEEDRLKKLKNYSYKTINYNDDKTTMMIYGKINMRSKAFINFKPLEELSLALNFPEGYKLIRAEKDNSQHSLLVSKNNLSEQFKYSTLITNYDKSNDRRYFESLFLRKPEEYQQLQKDAIPSITMSVELADDGGNGGIKKVFSLDEQLKFLKEIQQDFSHLDLSEIVDYYKNLIDDMRNEQKSSR